MVMGCTLHLLACVASRCTAPVVTPASHMKTVPFTRSGTEHLSKTKSSYAPTVASQNSKVSGCFMLQNYLCSYWNTASCLNFYFLSALLSEPLVSSTVPIGPMCAVLRARIETSQKKMTPADNRIIKLWTWLNPKGVATRFRVSDAYTFPWPFFFLTPGLFPEGFFGAFNGACIPCNPLGSGGELLAKHCQPS